jgi:DNA-binding Lrp family transcriptional regulator
MAGSVRAYILVSVRSGQIAEVAEQFQKMHRFRDVHPVYGAYDILAEIECPDIHTLERHVFTLRKVEGVTRSMTLIVQQ